MITLGVAEFIEGVAGTATAVTYTFSGDEHRSRSNAFKIIAQGQLPLATGTLYTSPSSTHALIKNITLVNTTSSSVTGVKLFINGAVDSKELCSLTMPGNSMFIFNQDGWKLMDKNGRTMTLC
jgi:hypothetical protein